MGKDSNHYKPLFSKENADYLGVEIEKEQFAIVGFLYAGEQDWPIEKLKPIKDATFFLNGGAVTTTDENGYFNIILSKRSLLSKIRVAINGDQLSLKVEHKRGSNFSILGGYFFEGRLITVNL